MVPVTGYSFLDRMTSPCVVLEPPPILVIDTVVKSMLSTPGKFLIPPMI